MKEDLLFQVRIVSDGFSEQFPREDNFICDEIIVSFGGACFDFYRSDRRIRRIYSNSIKFYGIEVLSQ